MQKLPPIARPRVGLLEQIKKSEDTLSENEFQLAKTIFAQYDIEG